MGNPLVKRIVSYTVLSSIFILGKEFDLADFTIRWYHFIYAPVLLWGIVIYRRISIKLIIVFAAILIYSVVTEVYASSLVFKQFTNIAFSCFAFYFFLALEEFNVEEIFKKYVSVAKVILVLGFIQVALFSIGQGKLFTMIFSYLRESNISFRFQSVSQEPSYIAYTFAPIVFLSLQNFGQRTAIGIGRSWSLLFIVGYILTFSLIAYVGLVLMVLLLTFRNYSFKKLIISVFTFSIIAAFSYATYTNVRLIRVRVNETVRFMSLDPSEYSKYKAMNLSTFTLLSNLYVTQKSFEENPVTGTGLGTYELSHEKFFPEELKYNVLLNNKDAGSLGFRLVAETGLVGLALFCFFIFRFKLSSSLAGNPYYELCWTINSGIFVMIILEVIRDGNYTNHGKFLFMLLYYYTYVLARERLKSSGHEPIAVAL